MADSKRFGASVSLQVFLPQALILLCLSVLFTGFPGSSVSLAEDHQGYNLVAIIG
jgi:hypothetical protein